MHTKKLQFPKFYACLPLALLLLVSTLLSKAQAQIITTIAGNGTTVFSGDGGPAAVATTEPLALIFDPSGNLCVTDGSCACIRNINAYGIISTIAGNGTVGFSGDFGPATSAELNPRCVAFDGLGNMYIADDANRRVRKVDVAGIITTFAGTGVAGYIGDGGAATDAEFHEPVGVTADVAGNVYISDDPVIRKINTMGIITTIAGNNTSDGFSGDGGPATAALLYGPEGMAVDNIGNLFFADRTNSRIRKIDIVGIITTIAGSGTTVGSSGITFGASGFSGDGGPATNALLKNASGIKSDVAGNIYIADELNERIRKVNTGDTITTIGGNGTIGFGGDGGPALSAEFIDADDVAVDCAGNVFVADHGNSRIRMIRYDHPPAFTGGPAQGITVCENATVAINTTLAAIDSDMGQTATWSLPLPAAHGTVTAAYSTTTTGGVLTPAGLSYTPAPGYSGSDSFKVRVSDCGFLTDSTTVYVTITPLPQAGAITGANSLCPGHTVHLTDTAAGGAWHSGNSNATVSAGMATGISAGADTIIYVVANTCGTDTAVFPVTVLPTPCDEGVAAIAGQEAQLTVFPNPNDGSFTFNLADATNEAVRITITNMVGSQVEAINAITNKVSEIKLDAPPGVYFINASTGSGKYNAKVVVGK